MQQSGGRNVPPRREIIIPVARPVTESERDAWLDAASKRNPPRMPDVIKLRTWLAGRNARKYLKLQQLIRWAEGEYGREFGILPEDARWLLP